MKKAIYMLTLLIIMTSATAHAETNIEGFERRGECVMTQEQRQEVETAVKTIAKNIKAEGRPQAIQIIRFQEWLWENVEYDDTMEFKTAYDAVKTGKTICTGYAYLAYEFCKQMNIPADLVQCHFKKSQYDHAILQVQVGGLWYYWDPTNIANIESLLMGQEKVDEYYETVYTTSTFGSVEGHTVSVERYYDRVIKILKEWFDLCKKKAFTDGPFYCI